MVIRLVITHQSQIANVTPHHLQILLLVNEFLNIIFATNSQKIIFRENEAIIYRWRCEDQECNGAQQQQQQKHQDGKERKVTIGGCETKQRWKPFDWLHFAAE